MISNFNIDNNFWKEFPMYIYIEPFDKLYNKDRSKDKTTSSKQMWSIAMLKHPSSLNPIRNLPNDQKITAIKKYYKDFDVEKVQEQYDKFDLLILSPVARAFKDEEESTIKRVVLINKLQDDISNLTLDELKDKDIQSVIKTLEMMRKNTQSIYDQYGKAKQLFMEEEGEALIFGGGKEDMFEQGKLLDLSEEE